jgi:hypothetical protein
MEHPGGDVAAEVVGPERMALRAGWRELVGGAREIRIEWPHDRADDRKNDDDGNHGEADRRSAMSDEAAGEGRPSDGGHRSRILGSAQAYRMSVSRLIRT